MLILAKEKIWACDFDKVFDENPEQNYFYNAPGYDKYWKLVVGRVSLKHAIERLKKWEVYSVVKYHAGEELPEEYIPVETEDVKSGDILFATLNPKFRVHYLCMNGGCIMTCRLPSGRYLLGPGPEEVEERDLIYSQLTDYEKVDQQEGGINL